MPTQIKSWISLLLIVAVESESVVVQKRRCEGKESKLEESKNLSDRKLSERS